MVVHGISIAAADFLHRIRLQQMSAVDDAGKGGNHADGSDLEGLAEGGGGQRGQAIGAGEVFLASRPEHTGSLACQVDACLIKQAVVLQVLPEGFRSHALGDLHQGAVAGVFHRLGEGLSAMSRPLLAVNGISANHAGAAAVEGIVHGNDPFFQGRSHHQALKVEPGS